MNCQNLILQGASFSAEDEDGSTALTLAIKRGHENVVQVIANHPKGCFSVAHSISATSLDTALWIGMAKGPRMAKIIAETMTKCVSQGDEWTNPELYKVDFKFGEHENTLLHRACMVFADDYCCNLVNELKQFLRLSPNAHKQLRKGGKSEHLFFSRLKTERLCTLLSPWERSKRVALCYPLTEIRMLPMLMTILFFIML